MSRQPKDVSLQHIPKRRTPWEIKKNFVTWPFFLFCETDLFVQLRVAEYLEENMSAEFDTEVRSLSDETSHLVYKTVVPVDLTNSQQLL
jgi:hypothetical protein